MASRLSWATRNKKNKWRRHVDLDEKWFYVYSHSGKLKLPPGVDKPRTPIKSKRFIGKVMMLLGIARPEPKQGFDGKVCALRVTKMHVCKKRTEFPRGSGEWYETRATSAASTRPWTATNSPRMLRDDVFPMFFAF